ncbi:MAG TPA: hypothetical protein VJH55_02955 [Candidatus Paceibacterota bacterium]
MKTIRESKQLLCEANNTLRKVLKADPDFKSILMNAITGEHANYFLETKKKRAANAILLTYWGKYECGIVLTKNTRGNPIFAISCSLRGNPVRENDSSSTLDEEVGKILSTPPQRKVAIRTPWNGRRRLPDEVNELLISLCDEEKLREWVDKEAGTKLIQPYFGQTTSRPPSVEAVI